MPIYMDRHDLPENVTAEHLAKMHQADLKLQHNFGCKGVTYWFDDGRKTAFCLIKAPNKKAIDEMHKAAHGGVPNRITEVDPVIVESFLGRIEDPVNKKNTDLNIIDDPAFRTIMVTEFKRYSFKNKDTIEFNLALKDYNALIIGVLGRFKGRIVKQNKDCFLVSFESATNAVLSALEIQSKLKNRIKRNTSYNNLKIGLSAGIPITDEGSIFEVTVKLAERMCAVARNKIVVSSELKQMYKSENLNIFSTANQILSLNQSDEKFLTRLMEYTETIWSKTDLKIDDFSKHLGVSKSQLYRKILFLTGKSPNVFIKSYRLNRALKLLQKQVSNISEIAFETGFNSPAYFSKCFWETFGILPSNYIKLNVLNS